jgi:hypothetical protein
MPTYMVTWWTILVYLSDVSGAVLDNGDQNRAVCEDSDYASSRPGKPCPEAPSRKGHGVGASTAPQ